MKSDEPRERCPTCGQFPRGGPLRSQIWDEAAAIGEMYKRGDNPKAIAKHYGRSYSVVYRILHERGIAMRARGRPRKLPSDDDLVALLRRNTHAAIAEHYGVSRQYISQEAKRIRENP